MCGETAPLPTAPSHLMEAFTDSLERLSVSKVEEGGTAVIVIDGADLIRVSITDFPSSVCMCIIICRHFYTLANTDTNRAEECR